MKETPVTVVGTLVSDVRVRRVGADERLVLHFRIASNERRFDKTSQSWVNGESLYLPVNCWRRLAENAASLVKGDPVIVSGRLRTREWTTEDGQRRSAVELEATAVGPDLARCTATIRRRRRDEEPVSPEDGGTDRADTVDLPHGAELADDADLPDGVDLADGVDLPEHAAGSAGVSRSELAEAARPLVPALA